MNEEVRSTFPDRRPLVKGYSLFGLKALALRFSRLKQSSL
jgi:hypothetical protein